MRGVYASETFSRKAEAQRWAAGIEQDIEARRLGKPTSKTWRDAIQRYRGVSERKRTATNESKRLDALERLPFADRPLTDITSDDWAQWREGLKIKPASVNRNFSLIRHVYRHICNEWGWLPVNPMAKIRQYPAPPPRRLLWTDEQIKEMTEALGYPGNKQIRQRVAIGFLFALETGMRSGEIFGLRKADIVGRVAHLGITKNGERRAVPLSSRALDLLAELPEGLDTLFGVPPRSVDAIFAKYRPDHLKHLRFHDARHTAATRIGSAGKLTALELCLIFGWRDPSHALIYFHPSASSLAAKLD